METSLFLAKLFGLYFLTIGAIWTLRREAMSKTIKEFVANRSMVFLSGLLALAAGIAITITHSIWEPNWRGLITLLGYLSVTKGVIRTGFPELPEKATKYFFLGDKDKRSSPWSFILLVLGAYLSWVGFALQA